MFLAAVIGAVVGGVIGGIISSANGGDFWSGAAVGATAGAVIGLTCGAAASYMATAGAIAGPTIFASTSTVLGTTTVTTATVTGGGTVLYSGGKAAYDAATKFANATGGSTINMTSIGQNAEAAAQAVTSMAESGAIWDAASAQFVSQARGVVNVFINFQEYRADASCFARIELPIILNNPNITGYVVHGVTQ